MAPVGCSRGRGETRGSGGRGRPSIRFRATGERARDHREKKNGEAEAERSRASNGTPLWIPRCWVHQVIPLSVQVNRDVPSRYEGPATARHIVAAWSRRALLLLQRYRMELNLGVLVSQGCPDFWRRGSEFTLIGGANQEASLNALAV